MKLLLRTALLASLALPLIPTPSRADDFGTSAASRPKRVGLVVQNDKKSSGYRSAVESKLGTSGGEVVAPSGEFSAAPTDAELSSLATSNDLDAIVFVSAATNRKGVVLTVLVYDARDGTRLDEVTLEGKNPKAIEKSLESEERIVSAVGRAQGRPEPEPEPEVPETAPVEAPPPAQTTESGPSAPFPFPVFSVSAGVKLYSRSFAYTDTLAQLYGPGYEPLVTYTLPLGPMPMLGGRYLPWANDPDSFLRHFGIAGGGELGVGTDVVYQNELFTQSHLRLSGGLVGAFNLGRFGILGEVRYGSHEFSIRAPTGSANANVFPSVRYQNLEFALGVEYFGDALLFGARAAHLQVLDTGALGSAEWFPGARGRGLEASGFVGHRLGDSFAVKLGVDARVYGLDFNPVRDDAPNERVAGGATDRYVSAWLALEFVIPNDGVASASVGSATTATTGDESSEPKASSFDSFD